MGSTRKSVTYFDTPGEENTHEVLKLAKKRGEELGIRHFVVASTRGETGVKASQLLGANVIVIVHHTGFREPGIQELKEENRKIIQETGSKIYIGTDVFMNIERAIRNKFNTSYPVEIMAQTLRLFGEGMKVAVEIVAMAADAGLIPVNSDVISLAGTGKGADTAIVVQAADSARIFDLTIKEIIAKPRNR